MRRIRTPPRPDWRAQVQAQGLVWHTPAGVPYWTEDAAYVFTAAQADEIGRAARDLYALFVAAGERIVGERLFGRFGIPEWCWDLIADGWNGEPPALNYGRFDLGYDGRNPPKLFEFNCDTPTSLLEASVIQWTWKEDRFPQAGQFNSIHDALVAKWRDIAPCLAAGPVHFTHARNAVGEDAVTAAYMMDVAREAGLEGVRLLASDIGWDGRAFVDMDRREIRTLFHLYPWEWLAQEPFARHLAATRRRTLWIEPIWKMIWSNKAILPILWEIAPGHPNLLWANDQAPMARSYVRKPTLAREGCNIQIIRDGMETASSPGPYGASPMVYQELYDLPAFDGGVRPVIGAWSVDGEPAGLGVREDDLITGDRARFVPHIVDG